MLLVRCEPLGRGAKTGRTAPTFLEPRGWLSPAATTQQTSEEPSRFGLGRTNKGNVCIETTVRNYGGVSHFPPTTRANSLGDADTAVRQSFGFVKKVTKCVIAVEQRV